MDLLQAMRARHSVRAYTPQRIEGETQERLSEFLRQCEEESGLRMPLILDEPEAFGGRMAHYGKFSGARNYIALMGAQGKDLDERCGYYGEKAVLYAQTLGLNSCWVALTYSKGKSAAKPGPGERLRLVIAVGYGEGQGAPHRSKGREQVMKAQTPPEWFLRGVDAALLAPTAMNQQKFTFTLEENGTVSAKAGLGFYAKVDLGIAKYHFELGAGPERVVWR